ncbi:MAG: anthranilate phosphoribosyltransferase, partial [Spirochaetaceae bacterium]|nr:anthranilate phosphoribosyltransferase [Spirochaetaceae bacterium]
DGFDEISLSAPTSVCEVRDGQFKSWVIEPEQFGFERCAKGDLTGGSPSENAVITRDILAGKKGPKRDAVLLNSAAAIHIAKPQVSIAEGIGIARDLIDSGKALAQLEQFISLSREVRG